MTLDANERDTHLLRALKRVEMIEKRGALATLENACRALQDVLDTVNDLERDYLRPGSWLPEPDDDPLDDHDPEAPLAGWPGERLSNADRNAVRDAQERLATTAAGLRRELDMAME